MSNPPSQPLALQPCTDLRSKQILLDPKVTNIVVETITSPKAKDNYTPWPTEWPNKTISDVLYLPNSPNEGDFPPILVEVQHTVDNDFILKLMTYAISYREHNKAPPIILTFVISSMKYEVSKKTTRNKNHPFLLQYSCRPWAQACYFVSNSSIQSNLTLPLHPFVALSTFFFGQHPNLLANPYHEDPTIQLLYSIATRIFQEQLTDDSSSVEDLLSVCHKAENLITQAMSTLSEEIPDVSKWSRTKKILEDGRLAALTIKRKYESISDSTASSSTTTNTIDGDTNLNTIDGNTDLNTTDSDTNSNTIGSDTNSNTIHSETNLNTIDSDTNTITTSNNVGNNNWEYLEQSLGRLIEGAPIPWEKIYDAGRALGLFGSYSKWETMKSNYYRWKKNQN